VFANPLHATTRSLQYGCWAIQSAGVVCARRWIGWCRWSWPQEVADAERTELWAGRGAAGRMAWENRAVLRHLRLLAAIPFATGMGIALSIRQ